MRKFLLSTIALLMSVAMMAVGLNDGTNKDNAIDFVWENADAYQVSSTALWYRVDLSELKSVENPTVAFTLNLPKSSSVAVTAKVEFDVPFIGTQSLDFSRTIAGKDTMNFSLPVGDLMKLRVNEVYVMLQADKQLEISAEYYEGTAVEAVDCADAINFDWNMLGVHEAGTSAWYKFDVSEVLKNKQHVYLTFTNHSEKTGWVMGELRHTCSGEAISVMCPVPAGRSISHVVDYSFLEASPIEQFYFHLIMTDVTISLQAETGSALANPGICDEVIDVQSGVTYEHAAGTQWYKFAGDLFENEGLFSRVRLVNRSAKTVTITSGITVDCQYTAATQASIKLPARFDLAVAVPTWVVDQLKKLVDNDVQALYMPITTDQPIAFSFGVEACETAIPFDWTAGHTQEAFTTQWYEVDIASVKANEQQVKLTFTNHSNTIAWVGSLVSLDCPFNVALPLVFPIPAGMSVDKVIDYSYFAATKLDHLYVGVTTEEKISVKAQAETAVVSDPSNCLNAIEVKSGEAYENVGTQWYKFSGALFNDMSSLPRFRFATPEGKTNITLGATVGCEYNIATRATLPVPGNLDLSFRFPSFVFEVLKKFINDDINEFYLEMTSDKLVEWSIDMTYVDACESAEKLTIAEKMDIQLEANTDVWYTIDLNEVKAFDKNITATLHNPSNTPVEVEVEISPFCPVLFSHTETFSVPASADTTIVLTQHLIKKAISKFESLVAQIPGFSAEGHNIYYVRVRANGDLNMDSEITEPSEKPEGCYAAQLLDWKQTINLSTLNGWYKFYIGDLHAAKSSFTLSVNNDMGEVKTLGVQLYEDCDADAFFDSSITLPVGRTSQQVPYAVFELLDIQSDTIYAYFDNNAPLPCEDAILFDWNKGAYQKAMTTQWYEFDITPVLEGEKQVKLTFTNHSNENAWVIAELALHCPYTKSIPIIVPVPANMSVDKWIDYSVFEASKLEHCYLGVTTMEADIELAAAWEDARIEPSEGCLNATKVENDVLYEHAAGTHWYKFTGDLFDEEGHFSRVRLVNRSAETVTITAGATVGCEYNIATRTIIKLPMRFDLAFALPVWVIEQMKKMVDGDVTEFYLELTTDQPIAFSFGQEACETAIPFDWTTGHTQEALTTQWYNVDIAPVLANEQQIKLTLTNHSNETAWVATLVSLDCPFKVALPLAFPIPAGMSVDKWIDYSYFAATKLDHLYVGVTTDSKVSITAEAQSAIVSDPSDCLAATTLKIGETYVHNGGTAWYKVDGAFFAEMGSLPRFRFATVSGETTAVTVGATVGCDYNIATRGTLNIPGGIDLNLRVPSFIFQVMKEFVNDDIHEVYIELTTDKPVEFSIDAADKEEVIACLDAIELELTDSMVIDLTANTDIWYKVDLSTFKTLNKDLAVTVINASAEAAKVEVEVSPTCPVSLSVLKQFSVPAATTATTIVSADKITEYLKEYPNPIYYVRVRATSDLHIEVGEPEVIEKEACEDAIEYVWGTPTVVEANSDVWYAIDVTDAKAAGKDLYVTVKNIDDITADVTAQVLYDCPGEVKHSLTKSIAAGEALSTTIASSELQGIESNVLYLHLVTTGDIEVTVGEPEVVEEDACLQAIHLNWNEEVTVLPGDTAWYAVNIADAKALQKNIKLTVKNESTESALVKADIAYDCPVSAFVHSMTKNIAAQMSISTTITYDRFENLDTDVLYIRIITTGELTIKATIEEDPIEETSCEDAIAYELGTVVSLPANADVWYAINIAPAKANQSDLQLTIINESENANEAEIQAAEECPVFDYLVEMTAVLDPLASIVETTTYDKYAEYADIIYLHIKTTDVLNFELKELQTKKYEVVTIAELVCDGTEFVDPVTNEKHIISSLIASTQSWSDTIQIDEWLDSVYVFNITPIVAPVVMTEALLETIPGATPVLTPGLVPNAVGTTEAINGYYASIDTETIADVDTVYWAEASLNTIVDCAATSHTMTLIVEAGCDNVITTALTFEVIPQTVVDTVEQATVCFGETYTWNGAIYDKTGLYEVTLTSATGCDSIAKLDLTVQPEVAETIVSETICASESFVWAANGMTYTESVSDTVTLTNVAGCDSVVILNLTVLPAVEETIEYATICSGEEYKWNEEFYNTTGKYSITLTDVNGCDSVVTLDLTVLPDVEEIPAEDVTICYGASYLWSNGKEYSEAGTYTYVVRNYLGCDSLKYTLNLTVLPEVEKTIETAAICEGETYKWQGLEYDTAGEYSVTLTDVNGCDSVVTLYLTINQPVTVDETIAACDSYTWNGETYTATGDYTFTTVAANGCDSIVTLHLTINKSETVEETITACDSYTWNGKTYTESGTYTYNTTTDVGCERIETLYLTINKPVTADETITACDSYTWNGETYTESGDYTFTTVAANGCDSIVTLHLTINKSEVVEETVTACDSYEWNGQTYTESGDYTFNTVAANGCDRTEILHLTINTTKYEEVTVVACDSYEWNGETYTESVDKTFTTVATNGCDSVVTLHLTITKSEVVEETVTACDSYTWNGETYTESGDYTYTTTTINGCDSVITLHLTINESVTAEETITTCGSYDWNGETYTTSGDYTYNTTTVNGCDSVVTLHLTILPEAVTENEELVICESEFPYEWRGEMLTAAGTYTVVEQYAATECDSVIHVLNLQTYVMTLPGKITDPIAVCGNAVDVVAATADIEKHIASVSLYAPNAVITWYILEVGNWNPLTDIAIAGNVDEVVVKYVITADCGSIESEAITIRVDDPNPANDVDMDNVLAVSKYENRVFLLHLNDFVATYDWTPTPEEVTWYKVVNGLDVYGEVADDVQVGIGHSYNEKDGSVIAAGEYYALIVRKDAIDPADCMTVMRTVILASAGAAKVPQLVPTIARPNENLTITNLNPEDVTEINVFSTTGELMATYVADQVAEFMFNAAHTSGYYMVDVETENGKFTLRYVVK